MMHRMHYDACTFLNTESLIANIHTIDSNRNNVNVTFNCGVWYLVQYSNYHGEHLQWMFRRTFDHSADLIYMF